MHSENSAKKVVPLKPKPARPRQKTLSNSPGFPALMPRHRLFVDNVLAGPEKTLRHHYQELHPNCKNKRLASNRASKILARPEVQDYMLEAQARIAKKAKKDQDDVAEELIRIGFAQITDIMEWDEEGNIILNPSKNLSDAAIAGIASIKCTQIEKTYNGETTVTRKFDVKMHDKLAALNTYLKIIGVDPNAGKPSIVQNVIVLPPEEPLEDSMARVRVFDVAPEAAGD